MTVQPTSNVSRAIDGVERLVADSPTFRDLTDSSSRAEALERIYLPPVRVISAEPARIQRPLAVVTWLDLRRQTAEQGAALRLDIATVVTVMLEIDAAATSGRDEFYRVMNFFGGVLDDICDRSGGDLSDSETYPIIQDVTPELIATRSEPTEDLSQPGQVGFWGCDLALEVR